MKFFAQVTISMYKPLLVLEKETDAVVSIRCTGLKRKNIVT